MSSLDTTEARLAPTPRCLGHDPDGDEVAYSWNASGGSVRPTASTNEVLWVAPEAIGSYSITCTVDDGRGGRASRDVQVSVGHPVGLVARYAFNGAADDVSGGGHDGTVFGASSIPDRFGNARGAIGFDGLDDYVDLGPDAAFKFAGSFSISLWFRIPDLDFAKGWGTILGNSDFNRDPFYAYVLHIDSLGITLNLRNADKLNQLIRRPVDSTYVGTWHHLAAVCDHDDRTWSGYLDGSLLGFTPIVGELVRSEYFRTMLGAGDGSYGGHGSHYRGDLDDLRVYTRPLAQEEIVAMSHEEGW
ncbi:MAG: LamG domain-containing protein [Gemmatimonadetes bacterium]|nr:LamG domain-containing protein [Gemmatimonadota bacterium]